MSDTVVQKAIWSSRSAFLLAAIGCAVGLGNLWRGKMAAVLVSWSILALYSF